MARWASLDRLVFAAALALAACDDAAPNDATTAPAPIAESPVEEGPSGGLTGTRPTAPAEDGAKKEAPAERREPAGREGREEARTPAKPPTGGDARQPTARDPESRPPGQRTGQPAARTPPPKPDGIQQLSATKWTVTRSLADQWMKNPYALGNVREAGAGWQLTGVRVKAAHWLGMRNGDVLMEANGHKLDTRPQLLAAYLDLKNDRVFRVTFVRNGQTMVHTYQIVEGGGGRKPAQP